jgi:hypothetical protein
MPFVGRKNDSLRIQKLDLKNRTVNRSTETILQ